MKLSFASTIHKIQGMTLTNIVLSMKSMFAPGMAYVGLSRVTALDGLTIRDFDCKKPGIFCNDEIEEFLQQMKSVNLDKIRPINHLVSESKIVVIHQNVEGLSNHINGIMKHSQISKSSIFIATETWLEEKHSTENVTIPNFTAYHTYRSACQFYAANECRKGGVSCYVKQHIDHEYLNIIDSIENIAVYICDFNCLIIGIYRAPLYPISIFVENLCILLGSPQLIRASNVIVVGDLNEDLNVTQNRPIFNAFSFHGFKQIIRGNTTRGGTLLDVIYFRGNNDVQSGVLQSWYSYHEPIYIVCDKYETN